MNFQLCFTKEAETALLALQHNASKKKQCKAVCKTLGLMETNLKHPSLNTHKYSLLKGPRGEDVFESYAENNTPGAWRIFWWDGPGKQVLTILAITPHP